MKGLHVVTVISNPVRFESRYRLFRQFAKRVRHAGAELTLVELAFGDRPFSLVGHGLADHEWGYRTFHEMWHKENLINLGIHKLPKDWEYVAWIDADIQFVRPDWVEETVQQLQHYMFVQMFSHAVDLGPGKELLGHYNGFIWSWLSGKKSALKYQDWHPGYAWACRREAYEFMNSLLDKAILGSGDRHMAGALIGQVETTYNHLVHKNYAGMCKQWQERAERYIRRDVGYVPGLVLHHWHGKKKDRQYVDRWKILIETQYDPFLDVKHDGFGVLELTDHNLSLRDGLRRYFRARNEDSIDTF